MGAVKPAAIPGLLAGRPDPAIGLYLVYGPDTGLVGERSRILAERAVDDPADPFQLVRLDGEAVAADPGRLADETATVGLFGGRRSIWLRPTSKNLVPAVEAVLQTPLQDCVVVIEAGDLGKSSPLRALCEKSSRALAVPCYADEGRNLADIVDAALREAGLRIGAEAKSAVLASLGGDRLASRAELAKLVLYVHGRPEITLADVDAILSDVSSLASDAVVDAAFAGDGSGLEIGTRRLAAEGLPGSVVLGAALRHAFTLLALRLDVDDGKPADRLVDDMRSLNFRRKPLLKQHLRRWTRPALADAVERLQAAVLDTRLHPSLDDVIAARTLLDVARMARR